MSLFSLSDRRTPAIVGALAGLALLAGGIAVWAQTGQDARVPAAASAAADAGTPTVVTAAPAPAPVEETTTTTAAPAPATTVAPKPATPPTTAARSTTKATTATTAAPAAAATPTPAPATTAPKVRSGARITPTSAQIQAAITSLHQRIPLFEPTEPQLMAFADAACTQFDQGQTEAQVEDAVRKAVTYIQGASLSSADAAFAVQTVVGLRCPGYLP